jgi:hypothetical protein
MLDFITSKGALTVAAMMLLVLMLSVVDMTNESAEQRNYNTIAESIADILTEINASPGNVTISLIFDDSGPNIAGITYPQTIGGETYSIVLYTNTVSIEDETGRIRAIAHISGEIHGWDLDECIAIQDPEGFGLTSEEIAQCDEGEGLDSGEPWRHDTSNAFVLDVLREEYRVDGELSHITVLRRR